jgi:hypothetical protein
MRQRQKRAKLLTVEPLNNVPERHLRTPYEGRIIDE